jgi:spore germination cell wall hydrolase CwlJ-like protein
MLGGMAKAVEQHARYSRLADAASDGFSELALTGATTDTSILAVARRLDPDAVAAPESTDQNRQLEALNTRLQRRLYAEGDSMLLRASLGGAYNPSVAPFHFPGALEGSRELDCLTQAVYYEARGETPSGQAAVAQVVLNRARITAFPKTVCGVVFQRATLHGCQFSFACDGSTLREREPRAWRRAQTVASRALDGFVMTEVGAATHFHTLDVAPMWGSRLLRVARVGMHVFYRFGGRAGLPDALTSDVEFAANAPADGATVSTVTSAMQAALALAIPAPVLVAGGVGGPVTAPVEPASAPAKPETTPVRDHADKPAATVSSPA